MQIPILDMILKIANWGLLSHLQRASELKKILGIVTSPEVTGNNHYENMNIGTGTSGAFSFEYHWHKSIYLKLYLFFYQCLVGFVGQY